MTGVATTGIGYSLAYPWAGIDFQRDHWLITVTQSPNDVSELFSPPGPSILVKGYGRVCYEFNDGGEIYYCPWIPVTISPMVIPQPNVGQGRTVQLVEYLEDGVSWNVTEVRTR